MNQKLHQLRLKYLEKKLKSLKPELFNKWRSELEEQIRKEYEKELERLGDDLFIARKELKESLNSRDYYKGKYEGVIEMQDKVQDKLITQVQKESTSKGQLKQEVKQLKQSTENNE